MREILQMKVRLLTLIVFVSVVSQRSFAAYFIDPQLEGRAVLSAALKSDQENSVLHFFSHGKEGELLVNGHWLSAKRLEVFFESYLAKNPSLTHINIYGCEFGKGREGRVAVAHLEKELGVSVSASNNTTGFGGDWVLEVGTPVQAIQVANYAYNLQYADSDDFDSDGISNSIDLDDDNDGILDTEECTNLGYTNYFGYKDDLMTAFCHGVIAKTAGGYVAWGNVAKPTSGTIGGTPLRITPANGFAYTGDILLATGGNHDQGSGNQTFLLTTTGLFVFGREDAVIPTSLTTSNAVESISLPSGVNVEDVLKITATYAAFALLTKDGKVYVLGTSPMVYGDGTTVADDQWHLVDVAATIVNVKVSSKGNVAMAEGSDGKLYTWGNATFLGDGTASAQQLTPVEMQALPGGILPGQIALGSANTTAAYYVLGRDGKVYSLGINGDGQMGDGTKVTRTTWGTVQTSSGVDLTNIVFINANDNSSAPAASSSVSAINNVGALYSWGYNASYTIGFPGALDQVYAGVPTDISTKVVRYVENGFHITPVIDSDGGICNVGHNAEGAFGDGTTTDREGYLCNTLLGGPFTLSAGLLNSCDLDADGIPNQYDLDSDGDGCPDSQEAGVVASFAAVQFADMSVDNAGGSFYAEQSQIAVATFVDLNSNGFDDRLETVTTGSYSGAYDYEFALNPYFKNCVPTTQAVNDINQTPLNKTVTGNVLTNDIDKQGDAQTVTQLTGLDIAGSTIVIPLTNTPTLVFDAAHELAGTLAILATGAYTFVPQTGYVGSIPFEYAIADSKGAVDAAELLIKVLPDLSPSQNPPVAVNDVNKVRAGNAVVSSVLANDSDVDGDVLTVTAATARNASGASVNLTTTAVAVYDASNIYAGTAKLNNNGTVTFTADVNYTGIVPISYTITDGTSTAGAILSITVDPPTNQNGIFTNDDARLGRKGVTQIGNVLTNDYDPENNLKTVTAAKTSTGAAITVGSAATLPSGGQFTLTATGGYTYVPQADFVGTEVIIYSTCDDGTPQACQDATLYLTTLVNDAALPVSLLSFTAKSSVEGTLLQWETANEFDFDRFVLQRSINSVKAFKEISTIKGGQNTYSQTDRSVAKGTNYYRLKMIDKNGSSAYSKIISVYLEYGNDEHVIFPNPTAEGSFYIHNYFKLDAYKVFNSSGKEVKVKLTEEGTDYKFSLDKSTPAGVYILQYKVDDRLIRRKLIVN